jgi:hypothetical protein
MSTYMHINGSYLMDGLGSCSTRLNLEGSISLNVEARGSMHNFVNVLLLVTSLPVNYFSDSNGIFHDGIPYKI